MIGVVKNRLVGMALKGSNYFSQPYSFYKAATAGGWKRKESRKGFSYFYLGLRLQITLKNRALLLSLALK